uniref:Uncharacterized protein LOC111102828 isoform X2 n=1 Tax=Crassostrea virginica TaxID=6565 RepID=A0A8B8ALE7_CRAVI|nr:uncharacterized protein LOC111102828 isoform X2 [Crassostrea virginica]XP_022291429.1 uncharacterized protein LOC111102828 isoform X2 [Crassostrea virginica]
MASTSYAATEEMTNINRVSRLLMDPCTDQLRDLLRSYIPPANFNTVIQRVKSRLPRLTEPQRRLILPSSGVYSGNYDDMDISFLYILLRNVCRIQAHNQGWGNSPDSADRSVSANIERLRLARNRCGHSTGGMSNAEFIQIWSEIGAAVVDLDKTLGIGNKYQEVVDFIRNDTMDPTRDRHFRDQLQEQIKETENIKKDVHSLQRKTEENDEQVIEVKQKLESFQQKINERNIPLNIQEQHKTLLESWLKGDKPFHEVHSFPNILEKVPSQPITTIIGGPGSGKTATARHLALRLQKDCVFEIVPVDDITEIKQYGNPKCKLVFILDDVIGVFGVDYVKLRNLEKYKESILNALGERSKILFTCRKAVYKEAANLKSFVLDKEYLVDLEDSNNQLNAEDRKQILNNHCKQHGISLKTDELPNVSSTVGCMMYPLLCKLFCSKSEYQALGKEFFENPYVCIRKEMDNLQRHMKIQYASLILCMFCQNEISEIMMNKEDPRFMEIKEKVFENCRVSGRNSEIKDALDHMNNTFTIRTDKKYSLIHDSVFEVLAFHYGNQFQEDMLEYMSSSFVAKKFSISDISDDPGDLHIKIHEEHYSAFAKRLVRDLKSSEFYGVFMNKTLKIKCICTAFIDELEKMTYLEIKNFFFQEIEEIEEKEISKMLERNESWEESKRNFRDEWERHQLLVRDMGGLKSVCRAINWVVSYGHIQLLQYLFDQVTKHKESIRRVLAWEVQQGSENSYISDLSEQTRLLILGCYSGDVEVVKLLLKHCDTKCINGSSYSIFFTTTPLVTASDLGHKDIVKLLIKSGADCNTCNRYGPTPLDVASRAGHVDIVDLLIKYGADCNKSDGEGATPLCEASGSGHIDIVDLLIKTGADCNKSDGKGATPLCKASSSDHIKIVDLLIRKGADCNKSGRKGPTPLCEASGYGHEGIVKMLIKNGADCNKSDGEGPTPLCDASGSGHKGIVKMLIKNGADCNQSGRKGATPLCEASGSGHKGIVKMLIKNGADCNKSDGYGETPLCRASGAGSVNIVKILIKSGADCNKCEEDRATPLCYASGAGHEDIVKMLIKNGADCNKSNGEGQTPLCEASGAGHKDIVDLLIKNGADCNKSNGEGQTPLCEASSNGHEDIVKMLIKNGADCNKSNGEGQTPLCEASGAGHVDIVDLLIKNGADCNKSGRKGQTPLCESSGYGHVNIVKMLIKNGTDCNKSGRKGQTPLCEASGYGHVNIVKMLIKNGADCNKSNGEGQTPLCEASGAGHKDIVDLLIKSGADCNKNNGEGQTPLCEASGAGHEDIVDLLIKNGADCNKSEGKGQTPLCQASGAGHVDIVDLLIKRGADCNKIDGRGATPLCYASGAGHEDIVDLLIKSGADYNKSDG